LPSSQLGSPPTTQTEVELIARQHDGDARVGIGNRSGVIRRAFYIFNARYPLLCARMFRDMNGGFVWHELGVAQPGLDLRDFCPEQQDEAGVISPKNDDDE
jgi:hypothetical protein